MEKRRPRVTLRDVPVASAAPTADVADSWGPDAPTLSTISRSTYLKEAALKNLFLVCAFVAVAAVLLIFLFVGYRGWPIFAKTGLGAFLGGLLWQPTAEQPQFGILALIINSLIATIGGLALGAPLAVGTAVFLSEVATPRPGMGPSRGRAAGRHPVRRLRPVRSTRFAAHHGEGVRRTGLWVRDRVDSARDHDPAHHCGHIRGRSAFDP
jgi:hypothetical protein